MERGFGVDLAALSTYSGTASGLAGEVGAVGTSTLAGTTSLAAGSFGRLGDEVGLGAAFQQAAQAQVDGVAAASAGLSAFASAVSRAGAAYAEQEAQHGADFNRAYRV
ncbi:hypothetical protein [Saccharothrix australiensis]|uniref:Excreted virulence factor EspC (Type VII ESX diderm) n=1 Tax=Saccharothrix australiensis TaxID=2072 RepID=A0A495W764_9PSEU|nr:hypothetical protein [Saccharothrix australiensis]RKT57581.1 hypothetical protein C8E97_6303 [Saccharothrix australiensis]